MSWKKGESGNAKGRPRRGHSITAHLSTLLSKRVALKDAEGKEIVNRRTGKPVMITHAQAIAANIVQIAETPDPMAVSAFEKIVDRMEGKVPLPVRQQVQMDLNLPQITDRIDWSFGKGGRSQVIDGQATEITNQAEEVARPGDDDGLAD